MRFTCAPAQMAALDPSQCHMQAAAARELTVSFNADVADGMPWRFVPAQRSVKVCTSRESLQ